MLDDIKLGLLAFIVLLAIGLIFIRIEPPQIEPQMVYAEQMLHKNRNFSLPSGMLVYLVNSSDGAYNATFGVSKGLDCTLLYPIDGEPISCVKADGTDENRSNVTLMDRGVFFFRPWMLALNDSWSWQARGCYVINKQLSCDLDIKYKVTNVAYENDKKYYVVRMDYADYYIYQWIEDDRRILAKEIGPGYTITLLQE